MSNKIQSKNLNFDNVIKNSNTLLKIYCCLTIIVLICILIGNYAFKNGILTCEHYIFNTYLYIILSILLVFIIVLVNDHTGFFNSFLISIKQENMFMMIFIIVLILIILFGLIYALRTINPNNIIASNLVWLLIILIIGVFSIPVIWFGRLTDVVGMSGMITVLITIIVGIAGYYYGDKIITFNWDKYLNYSLWILILALFIGPIFIRDANTMMTFLVVMSIISLGIFVLLLLSNHKNLKEAADKCIDGKAVPNYPFESFGIFIKMLNIFKDLIRILGARRLRR
jgi:NADH:ubiquinone oxidoreductase subunit 2 (subunit N)